MTHTYLSKQCTRCNNIFKHKVNYIIVQRNDIGNQSMYKVCRKCIKKFYQWLDNTQPVKPTKYKVI